MRKWPIVAVVVGLGIATYYAMDLFTTDAQRVTRLIRRLASRLEKRDGPGVCSLLAEDYHDQHRHGNRGDVCATLALLMPYLQSLSVQVEDLRVEVSGEKGTASFLARVDARPAAKEAELEHWSSRVVCYVKKVKGEWVIGEAEYQFPAQIRMLE